MSIDLDALSGLSLEEIEAQLAALLSHRRDNRMDFWTPYPKQREFIAMGADKDERLLMAPNQAGKCIYYNTLVDHPDGTQSRAGDLFWRGKSFDVLAWTGSRAVVATVSVLIRKPPEPGVRLYLKNGRIVDCAWNHRMMDACGQWRFARRLVEGLPCLSLSNLGRAPAIRAQDGSRWKGRVQDFLEHYSQDCRLDGGRLLFAEAAGQSLPTSLGGVRLHTPFRSPLGGRSPPKYTNSGRFFAGHHSTLDEAAHSGGRFSELLDRIVCSIALRTTKILRAVVRLLAGSLSHPRSIGATPRHQECERALMSPMAPNNAIIAYSHIESQDVYDFTVPVWHNYIAAGCVHHNTLTGADETAAHLTGLYPADWAGRIWRRPVAAWAAGVSGEVVRDVQQNALCGNPHATVDYGTGFIPKHCLVDRSLSRGGVANAYDTVTVQHHTDGVPDGTSLLQFKAYKQGQLTFQGRTLDFVWWDEEPDDMAIYTEGNARWTATGGMSFMTFTPWQGYTEIVNRFMNEPNDRRGYVHMTAADAPHLTPDILESMKSKYPEHEWPARIYGDPALGAGQIFTVDPAQVKFPYDLPIEPHWHKIWGIDFGLDHPFAAVLLACDRDTDEDYIIATYRGSNALPIVHADALRRICALAPVAWPHDGNVRSRGEGGDLTPLYKQFDLNMLPSHAHYPGGGYSTEAAVMDMQQGFQKAGGPGGLRVREDLHDFFEEYRMYHRSLTRDGGSAIVKRHDDLISACQKARMMKRYARPVPLGYRPRAVHNPEARHQMSPILNPWTGEPAR